MEREALKLALEGAANYIDVLGGDSKKYRQALAQPEQENKHIVQSNGRHSSLLTHMMNKRTAPPQRTWVGLTGDELADLWYKESLDWMEFARAVEAEIKEKNF
jgi:hypothetical protein